MPGKLPGRLLCTALIAALAGPGCSDDSTAPPQPWTMLLSLSTPASDDGAVLVTITGPGITAVQPTSSGQRLFWRLHSSEDMRVIVIGQLSAGPLLTLHVADVNRAAGYSATITEVAGRDDSARASLSGYAASLSRVGAQ